MKQRINSQAPLGVSLVMGSRIKAEIIRSKQTNLWTSVKNLILCSILCVTVLRQSYATQHLFMCFFLQNNLIMRKRLENYELNRIKSHLDFHRLCLGLLQRLNQICIIHRASFRSRQFVKNLVFNLLQFLSHFSVTNNQLVLGFL